MGSPPDAAEPWAGSVGYELRGLASRAGGRSSTSPRRRRHCILLWMSGGPSQTDTFDMKPGHENGGEFKEIQTSVPGLRFSEHLPNLAKQADWLAVVRSLSTKEGDHARGTHWSAPDIRPLAALLIRRSRAALAKELATDSAALPNYVTVAPPRDINPAAFEPGFLGPGYAPAIVATNAGTTPGQPAARPGALANLKLDDLELPANVDPTQAAKRLELWKTLERKFFEQRKRDIVRCTQRALSQSGGNDAAGGSCGVRSCGRTR